MSDAVNNRIETIAARDAIAGKWAMHRAAVWSNNAERWSDEEELLSGGYHVCEVAVADRADVPDLLAIVEALPRCECGAFATWRVDDFTVQCDPCKDKCIAVSTWLHPREMPYAAALRNFGGTT